MPLVENLDIEILVQSYSFPIYRIISVRGFEKVGKCLDCTAHTNSQIESKGRTSHALCTCINTGGGSATMKLSKHDRKQMSKERKIGHIRRDEHGDYMVKMGTTDEAVIGIKMLPISTLITDPELRRKVVATTKSFFEKCQDYSCKLPYINTVSHERHITMVILSSFLLILYLIIYAFLTQRVTVL